VNDRFGFVGEFANERFVGPQCLRVRARVNCGKISHVPTASDSRAHA
jgi:hypothetical protein